MGQDNTPTLVESWLETLGIALLSEWDVLVFLYRHRASLVSAEHIARLLGYATGAVVAALDRLEALGFVERSRVSQAVRLYQFSAPDGPRRSDAWERLLGCADSRAVRLHLAQKLRRDDPANPNNGPSRLHLPEGSATWLKVI